MQMNDVIAHALRDMGVDQLFGVIGDANLFIVDKFVKQGGRYTSATNEANAVLMASGYAQVSGTIGVATVTCGPGLTNALTALVEGVKGHIPMVLITGDGLSKVKYHPQKIPHRELIMATGAGYEAPGRVEDVQRDLVYAFQRAYAERRPIVFNFPSHDLQWQDIGDYHPPRPQYLRRHTQALDSPELDAAIGIVASAKRPIVIAGYGVVASDEAAQVLKLAERLDAPIMSTLRTKDLYRGNPRYLGVLGISGRMEAMDAITVSDCIVAFGASLNFFTSGHGAFFDKKRIVMVLGDEAPIGQHGIADATVLGGMAAVAERVIHWLDEAEIAPSGFASEDVVKDAVAAMQAPYAPPEGADPQAKPSVQEALAVVEQTVEEKRVLATDGGRFMRQPWQLMHVTGPRYFMPGNLFGAIGTGIGYALGGACAARDIPTIAVVGDGGFMLGGLTDFHTAVREQLDLIVVVCNDGGYGAEYLHFTDHDLDPALALFDWPEFAEVARAMGGQGYTVHARADLAGMKDFIQRRSRKGPILVDIKLDPKTMPRTF
ncbi:MAG: thiamine pyrophosphate-binding protein [Comamonadaceae bacterium]|nr:thiamine pyrophosphate-binding protein [Burkholderiales bacterium]MEB2347086.1 thiamine pyrophosphate-binding protein [Comamonadaceae bacterium]